MRVDCVRLDDIGTDRLWIRPLGLLSGHVAAEACASGTARPLACPWLAYTLMAVFGFRPDRRAVSIVATVPELEAWLAGSGARFTDRVRRQLTLVSAPRVPWAGFTLDRPLVMGVLNVTPDSFSDGGLWFDAERAIAHGQALAEAGADIIDVGGESTRPGATPLPPGEEVRRIEPVVRALAQAGRVVSIDTRHKRVIEAALAAGARIVNDVSALRDPGSAALVAGSGAAVILMHMQGEPQTMQHDPVYDSALIEVLEFLDARVSACIDAGIPREQIAIDPGIGFGKQVAHNLELINGIGAFHALGCPIVLGVSRKSTIARLSRGEPPEARLPGSLAAALYAVQQGVQILRVHDVAETRQALAVWEAIAAS
jgi:dihydropteroate synthase